MNFANFHLPSAFEFKEPISPADLCNVDSRPESRVET
jgi:hypothetical protein